MNTSNATHNEWMIHRELADEVHLSRERPALLAVLAHDEELLDVASAGLGFGAPGILAITDRRLIHVYFRRTLRRMKVTEMRLSNVASVDSKQSGSSAELRVRLKSPRRTVHMPIDGDAERATALAITATRAVRRFDFHASRGPE